MWHWIGLNPQLRMGAILHLTCLLTFCLILGWLQLNFHSGSVAWLEKNLRVSLFLAETISAEATQALHAALAQDSRIHSIKKFSPEESLVFLQKQLPLDPNLLASLDKTILPATLDFQIAPQDYHHMADLVRELQRQAGVVHVVFPQPIFELVGSLSRILEPLPWVLFFLSNFLVILTLFYLLRLFFEAHREAIELLDLSGASFFSICWVFLLEVGLVLGISTLLSGSLTFICYRISQHLPFFQKVSLFFNQSILFYEWQALWVFGLFTFVLGEAYTYWMIKRWYLRLRRH